MILKKFFNVGIFLAELNYDIIEQSIRTKYNFTEEEIADILNNCIFNVGSKPIIIKANTIIFTDGGYSRLLNFSVFAKHVILFSCGDKNIKNNTKINWHILQDSRVYEDAEVNSKHYIKKILFNRLKTIDDKISKKTLLYVTENCRDISDQDINHLFNRSEEFIVISNNNTKYQYYNNVESLKPPVRNIFEQFTKYIYTPIARQWDCSPRLIAECKFYNKEVEYFKIDYLDIDLGLKFRKQDIEDNFDSLFLTDNDEIINIIKGIIC
jgi:hypothetical protein